MHWRGVWCVSPPPGFLKKNPFVPNFCRKTPLHFSRKKTEPSWAPKPVLHAPRDYQNLANTCSQCAANEGTRRSCKKTTGRIHMQVATNNERNERGIALKKAKQISSQYEPPAKPWVAFTAGMATLRDAPSSQHEPELSQPPCPQLPPLPMTAKVTDFPPTIGPSPTK